MTHQGDLHPRDDVASLGLEVTTLQITPGIRPDTTTASGPPGRETPTGPHAASPSSKWTCRDNQVHNWVGRPGLGRAVVYYEIQIFTLCLQLEIRKEKQLHLLIFD